MHESMLPRYIYLPLHLIYCLRSPFYFKRLF